MKPPRQAELDLNPEAPPPPVVVGGADLARTIAELRASGFEVWAMDVRRATYTLHLHRSMTPPHLRRLPLQSQNAGYARHRVFHESFPNPTKETSAPTNPHDTNRIRQALWT